MEAPRANAAPRGGFELARTPAQERPALVRQNSAHRPPQVPGGERVTPVMAGPPRPGGYTPGPSQHPSPRSSTPSAPGPRASTPGGSAVRSGSADHRHRAASPSPAVRSASPAPRPGLSDTLHPKPLYVGDRIRVKGSSRTGTIMYVGHAGFSAGKDVAGIKLDQKRTQSDCDGKFDRERYFRCKPGYGIYLPVTDVEKIEEDDDDEPPPEGEEENEFEQPFALQKALDLMVGQGGVKTSLQNLRNLVEVQKKRAAVGVHDEKPLHFAVVGSPGAGVTFTSKLLGQLLRDLGIVERGHVVEVARKDLVDEAEKRVEAALKRAKGGVLVIKDAQLLKDPERTDSSGMEVVQELLKRMESQKRKSPVWPQDFTIVFSGPRAEVQTFLGTQAIKVVASLDLVDFTTLELAEILTRIVHKRKFTLSPQLAAEGVLEDIVRQKSVQQQLRGNTRNLHLVNMILEDAISRQSTRVWEEGTVSFAGLTMLVEADFQDPEQLGRNAESEVAKAFGRLDAVVGLDPVKAFVRSLSAQLMLDAERRAAGIEAQSCSTVHMIFQGSPGTGKTTVARVVAELLKGIGWLKSGHLVEVDRGQLVAGYAGQTAIKTKAAVESALGGVLFVDEAYALVQQDKDSFGREALDTLIKLIEDYRSELVVILAGYTDCMAELMSKNPGLKSRFPTAITFPDYTSEEMMAIAEKMLLNDVLVMDAGAEAALTRMLGGIAAQTTHSNGRAVRNVVEQAKRNQATRLQKKARKTKEDLCCLMESDFENINLNDME